MKSMTTLSSIVLLASSLGFASTAMAGADRVVPTRGGTSATNPTGSATGTGTVNAPAISVTANGTASITPTVTGGTVTGVTATAGTQGTFTCTAPAGPCTYTETQGGAINNDTVFLAITYTINGTSVTVNKAIPVTVTTRTAS